LLVTIGKSIRTEAVVTFDAVTQGKPEAIYSATFACPEVG